MKFKTKLEAWGLFVARVTESLESFKKYIYQKLPIYEDKDLLSKIANKDKIGFLGVVTSISYNLDDDINYTHNFDIPTPMFTRGNNVGIEIPCIITDRGIIDMDPANMYQRKLFSKRITDETLNLVGVFSNDISETSESDPVNNSEPGENISILEEDPEIEEKEIPPKKTRIKGPLKNSIKHGFKYNNGKTSGKIVKVQVENIRVLDDYGNTIVIPKSNIFLEDIEK